MYRTIKSSPEEEKKNFIPVSEFIEEVLKIFTSLEKLRSLLRRSFVFLGEFKSHSLEPHHKTRSKDLVK